MILKIFLALIAIFVFGFLFWFCHTVIVAALFDNDKCKNCPLRDKCMDAVHLGMPTLCNNSEPLYTNHHFYGI